MGLCASTNSVDPTSKVQSKKMDADLLAQHQAQENILKLLLLGAGESGKSTLFKQIQKIYGGGFQAAERKTFKEVIESNIRHNFDSLVEASKKLKQTVLAQDSVMFACNLPPDHKLDKTVCAHYKALWDDPGIQAVYEKRAQFQLYDNCEYFARKLDVIASEDYLPSEEDVLRARIRTSGIIEHSFSNAEGNRFVMFDVGGQRNERKKWMHCFDNVTAVLFIGVLSEYDQKLFEDESMNRMQETLKIFEDICNSSWFKETSIILFLNKSDLFREKIQKVPLSACPLFPEQIGIVTYEKGVQLIENIFRGKSQKPSAIYCHVTCATDTSQVEAVFRATSDILIRQTLKDADLI